MVGPWSDGSLNIGLQLQKDLITNLKRSLLVNMCFHALASSMQVLLYQVLSDLSFFQPRLQGWHDRFGVCCDSPVSRVMSVQCLERGHANNRVIGRIIPELCQWNPEAPALGTSMSETMQKSLRTLVNTLCLTISLRMVRYTHPEFSAGILEELTPEVACEDWTAVRYNSLRESMQFVHLCHVEVGNFCNRVGVGKWKKMSKYGSLIHQDKQTIESARWRQSMDEVHGDDFPRLLGNRQGCEQTWGC